MKLHIFQTWKTKNSSSWPYVYKKCQESWERLHPNVPYKLYDDLDNRHIISNYFPGKLEEVYKTVKNRVEKADIIRCAILFLHGGLYADMDFMALKSHEDIFNSNDGIVLGSLDIENKENSWYMANSISNAWMMSKHAGEIFWFFVLDNICEMAATNIKDVEVRTGPVLLKKCIERYVKFNDVNDVISSLKHINVYIRDISVLKKSNITILEPEILYPNSWTHSQLNYNRKFFEENDWDAIRSKFPNSLAFTYWAHNW
jgi:mannosyltransferase OCH1-like enzyme